MEEGNEPRDPDGAVLLVRVTTRPSNRAVRANPPRRGRPLRRPARLLAGRGKIRALPPPLVGEVRRGTKNSPLVGDELFPTSAGTAMPSSCRRSSRKPPAGSPSHP